MKSNEVNNKRIFCEMNWIHLSKFKISSDLPIVYFVYYSRVQVLLYFLFFFIRIFDINKCINNNMDKHILSKQTNTHIHTYTFRQAKQKDIHFCTWNITLWRCVEILYLFIFLQFYIFIDIHPLTAILKYIFPSLNL